MKKWTVLLLVGMVLLAGCGGGQAVESEPTEAAAEAAGLTDGKVIAEGAIEPARWSEVQFEVGGTVAEVLVTPGEAVAAGDVLVRLDATDAELAVQEAQAAVAAALAEVALAQAGPRAEEVAATEADLAAAQAALARAAAQQDQVTGGSVEAEIAQAEAEVTAAQQAQILARDTRDDVRRETDDEKAKQDVDYQLYAAEEALAAAQAKVAALREIADDKVREAQAGVWSASAQEEVAQAELALLQAGSAAWEVEQAAAGVLQAEAVLAEAEVALGRTEVVAPFDGVVTKVEVEVGDTVTPGEVVLVVAALDRLEVHTVDLTELDVADVAVEQRALVTVDALPGEEFAGVVREIALRAGDYRGDVVYAVTVALEEPAPELRWGMTALVEIEAD
jgi:multidrug efflux pump subunit AcrA (membrane-fusion protein)